MWCKNQKDKRTWGKKPVLLAFCLPDIQFPSPEVSWFLVYVSRDTLYIYKDTGIRKYLSHVVLL